MWMLLGAAAAPRSKPLRLAIQPVIPTALVGLLICVPFLLNIAGDIQLERGRSAEVGNDLLGAQAYYESASSLASWQPAMEEVRARFAIRASDFNTAQKASREATTRSGNQLRWRELEAETMLSAEQYAQSFAAYQALLRERQNDSSLYVGLGFASLGLVDNSGALVAFNTALQINPDSVGAQAGLEELRKK